MLQILFLLKSAVRSMTDELEQIKQAIISRYECFKRVYLNVTEIKSLDVYVGVARFLRRGGQSLDLWKSRE